MSVLPSVCRRLALWCLTFCAAISFACEQIPTGESVWIRLTQQVSTYNAKVGDPVHAVLTEEMSCGSQVVAPVGAPVDGSVKAVRKVGYGVRHETAALQIVFERIVVPDGELPIQTVLTEVENAREQVSGGIIRGVLSTYTPQGRITSRFRDIPTFTLAALNPYPDVGLLAFKATFPIFPEPEIFLPIGTDLQVKLTEPLLHPPVLPIQEANEEKVQDKAGMDMLVGSLPQRSTTATLADADLVNLVFIGSQQQLQTAFRNAGWQTTDEFNKHTFILNLYAFLNNSGYARAPMRPFLLEGQSSAMNLQKSLNSYAKRDHLRVWQWPESFEGQNVWVSSSTHDVSASLSLKHREFVHHIDPDIDEERSKIVRDLRAAGCVQSVYLAPRRGVANISQNATGDVVKTDGAVAVVQLQNCHAVVPELASTPTTMKYKPGNIVFRYMRRQVLTFRSDIWRANIIYGAYDLTRMSVRAWKHRGTEPLAREREKKQAPGEVQSTGIPGSTSAMD